METLPLDLFTNNVLSYVGDDQFRFVASVNRSFYSAYTSLYPKKQTVFNVSAIELVKLCYLDIEHQKVLRKEDILRRLQSYTLLSDVKSLQK
jgi:hypothetical protein